MKTHHQNITFLNIAGDWQSQPSIPIASAEQLRTLLADLSNKEPGIINLDCADKGLLQLGIGGEFTCAQFTTCEDKPRYLSAKAREIRAMSDIEFLCGGTPTPISPELCLSFEEVVQIAEHFFKTGERDPSFEWVEI